MYEIIKKDNSVIEIKLKIVQANLFQSVHDIFLENIMEIDKNILQEAHDTLTAEEFSNIISPRIVDFYEKNEAEINKQICYHELESILKLYPEFILINELDFNIEPVDNDWELLATCTFSYYELTIDSYKNLTIELPESYSNVINERWEQSNSELYDMNEYEFYIFSRDEVVLFLFDKLIMSAKEKLPKAALNEKVESFIKGYEEQCISNGVDFEEEIRCGYGNYENLQNNLYKQIGLNLSKQFVLNKILNLENITVSKEEIENEMPKPYITKKLSVLSIRNRYIVAEEELKTQKVFKFLWENNKFLLNGKCNFSKNKIKLKSEK